MTFLRRYSLLFLSLLGFLFFAGLVYFNYQQAQKAIQDTRPAPLSIKLISYPDRIQVGRRGTFIWKIDSSPDLATSYTTLFWGYQSTSSALMKLDSPEAVGYPHSELDYASGSFRLPDTFDVSIFFNRVGQVWFRAYANIRGEHLWSDEHTLNIEK